MKDILINIIKFYKAAFSPYFGGGCRFTPTCSSYAIEAISKYGYARGVWFSIKRIFKCHPLHKGGFDPIR